MYVVSFVICCCTCKYCQWCVVGAKFSQTADCTRIIECDGTSLTLESTSGVQHLAPETRELWEYVHEVIMRSLKNFIAALCLDVEIVVSPTSFKNNFSGRLE